MKKKLLLRVNLNIPVALIKEGGVYVVWTPALDISTSGKTEYLAKKSFDELINVFFDEFADNPTGLEVVLESQGWVKQKQGWQPPKVTNTVQNVSVEMAV